MITLEEKRQKQREATKRWYHKNKDHARNIAMKSYYKNHDDNIKRARDWKKNHPDSIRNSTLKQYGLDIQTFEDLAESQHHLCAICNGPQSDKRQSTLDVDHCHKSNRVRGLLCRRCNLLIGYAKDDPVLLDKAASYLRKSND